MSGVWVQVNIARRMAALACCCVLVVACGGGSESPIADKVFYNGNIVTVDSKFSIASAIAIRDGRILAVGGDVEIRKLSGTKTVSVDLDGKTVLPGLIDSHMHPDQASTSEIDHQIPDMRSVADVQNYVRARADVVPDDEIIWVRTVFPTRLLERRYPTKAELDEAAPSHPVIFAGWIFFPKASLNSAALDKLGIDQDFARRNSADIEQDPVTGEPTGLIRNHTRYVEDSGVIDPTNDEQRAIALRDLMSIYNAAGLTTISDRKVTPASIAMYELLAERNQLSARIAMMHLVDTNGARDLDDIVRDIEEISKLRAQLNGPTLKLIGIKTFLDGGITSGTAYMLEPWGKNDTFAIADPEYRGRLSLSGDRLESIIHAAAINGLQFTGHVVGDAAVTELVRAYSSVSSEFSIEESRPALTHANFMTPAVIETMAELGIVADMQPAWLYLDARNLVSHFGPGRLRYFQPLKSLFEAGVTIGGGSDHWHRLNRDTATNPFNPFLGMWITLTRSPQSYEGTINSSEALSREQALRLYTSNNAYLLFMEDDVGSLEPGKYADMIVIDRDILTCDLADIRHTKVLQTYLNGDLVYAVSD
jgi:predicted amidohydrolase YtcJ